ncbi:MAG: class II aldolase/adducin family protein [Clostridia bacterium]
MYDKELKQMAEMSVIAGKDPDITQGGGGNTSVKLDGELMAVKASGCKLKDMTECKGFVVLNYRKVREYYDRVDLDSGVDYYADSAEFVKNNSVELPNMEKGMRASVEAGFHSLLKKYVVHTHSVYANLLCCTREGKDLAAELFGQGKHPFIWLPYTAPGFMLTLEIKRALDRLDSVPGMIFMESHGLIITSDQYEECRELGDMVTEKVRTRMGITEPYGHVGIQQTGENTYASDSDILRGYFQGSNKDADWFERTILYPDQAAYLSGNISTDPGRQNKININLSTGDITYATNQKEALTMEESIAAFIFILETAGKSGLHIMTMTQEQIDFIKNWEGVQYRKNLLKK